MQAWLDLTAAARQGDLEAFGGLVEQFQDMAFGAALARLGDFHHAQDATQDAFIEAFRDLKQLRETHAFPAWLRQIVLKHCDRRLRRRGPRLVPLEASGDRAMDDSNPAVAAEKAESKAMVLAALNGLPEDHRMVTTLYYIGGHSTDEIAGFLEVPLTTVKKRLHDSREKLKERMLNMVNTSLHEHAPSRDSNLSNAVQMINACKVGDLKKVRTLLKLDPRLVFECKAEEGRFLPLHYAVREGHADVVQALLDSGADPQPYEHMMRNHLGITTLDLARARGFGSVVSLVEAAIRRRNPTHAGSDEIRNAIASKNLARIAELVKRDSACVKAADDDGNTPLHRAAEADWTDAHRLYMDEWIQLGADLSARNSLGHTPVDLTLFPNSGWPIAQRPRPAMTGYLLAKGAAYTIHLAASLGDLPGVRRHLERDAKLAQLQSSNGKRPLSCAAEFGHTKIVKLLLEHGADPNATESDGYRAYPLYAAAKGRNLEMARALLDRGADPNAWLEAGGNAMSLALEHGHQEMADLLASYGGCPYENYWAGNLPVMATLFAMNPNLGKDFFTVNSGVFFDTESAERTAAILKLAMKYGADPKTIPQWSLFVARHSPGVLKTLLEHGAHPNAADEEGKTTLHAIQKQFNEKTESVLLESAAVLIDHGADLRAQDHVYRATPLTWAAIFGNLKMVAYLLSRGSATNLPDDEPWTTPLFWAEYKGHKEVAELLRKHGATR
ncbi:MAG: hypothetical protein AMXMBFR7_36710 [Planctomycetota bacterium]